MALTREQTVQLAVSKVGVEESPPYSNKVEFSSWYGFIGPWCAMYLSWVLAHAGNTSGYRFASTASSVAWARGVGRLIPVASAKPGDILVRLYTSTTGHTGMATESPVNGLLLTVEGNTSGLNDRDGGSVMLRRRSLSWWHYCIRIDYPLPPPPATTPGVTVYNPPLTLPRPIASSAKDPLNGGSWILLTDGAIYALDGARYLGAANGKGYFLGRTAQRLEITPDGRYIIVATSGEKYGPNF